MATQPGDDRPFSATPPENYERFFVPVIGAPLAADLVDRADLSPGDRVLDVACGTGVVARLAAERVGDEKVAGLDLNPGMLAVARSVASSEAGIAWHEGSAESLPLPDAAFDAVLCQLGLQFMEDRAAAVREMHRVLDDGGRLVLSVAGPTAPPFAALATAMGRHIAPPAEGFVRQVFALHGVDEIEQLLQDAAFRDVEVAAREEDFSLPGPRDFLWQYTYSTPLAAVVADAGDDARDALEEEVTAAWRAFEHDGGMRYRQRIVTATARK
jgi:ubiquinone/menaquinone biosynthesis C-methylase UbiE